MEFDVFITGAAKEKQWLDGKTLKEKPSIAAYLVNFDAGRSATPESPFCDNLGYGREEVLLAGRRIITEQATRYPRLMAYEESRIAKYGPQGWIYPLGSDEMIAKIRAYYDHCHRSCKPSDQAKKLIYAWADQADLSPYSYAEVIARGLTKTELTSNSGFPSFTKRNKVISESMELAKRSKDQKLTFPAVIGARSIKQKMRLIFMAPFEQNIRELSYVYPVMDYLLTHSSAVAGWRGQPYVQQAVSDEFFHNGKVTLLSTDFTAMDTSMGIDQMREVRDLMIRMFKPQYREELRTLLDQSITQEVVIGAATQPGEANQSRNQKHLFYLTGAHGLFSGLGFTNLAETLLQMMLDADFELIYPTVAAQINGDDGAKAIDGHRNMDQVAETFATLARAYGLDCNAEKQFVSYDELHYLQRVYSPETEWNGIVHGAYPLILTLNSAKNPERDKFLTDYEQAVRVMMIFENLADSPIKLEGYKLLIAGSPVIQRWIETGAGSSELTLGYDDMVKRRDQPGSNLADKQGFSQLDVVKTLNGNMGLLKEAVSDYGSVI